MTGNKESESYRKKRKWIETSSGNSKEHKGKSSEDFMEDVNNTERTNCKKKWHATNLGEA